MVKKNYTEVWMKYFKISSLVLIIIYFANLNAFAPQPIIEANIYPPEIEAGGSGRVEVRYIYPEGMHQILQEEYFFFEIKPKAGFSFGEIDYPEGELWDDGFIHLFGESILKRSINISSTVDPGEYKLSVIAAYQLCYDETGTCIMPDEQDLILDLKVLPGETGSPLLLYLIFALLGGFILNLTPCVLPVLSLRAFSLINQSQSDRKKITMNSLVYCLGILFSFLILAVIIIALKTTGQMVGWGFQFQNPTFVIVMTSILFVFALSLFDVFTIVAPDPSVAGKLSNKGGLTGAFFMGIFAVLLGTPCTAPILGAALTFAFAQKPLTILLMFIFIGIGMGIPFIVIAIKPNFVKKLPKPGEWMNVLKELMGFLLLFWAIKMLEVLHHQIGGRELLSFLFFLLALGISFRIIGRYVRPDVKPLKKWIAFVFALLIIINVGISTLSFDENSNIIDNDSYHVDGNWQVFDPDKIEELREEGVPVFIDFTAKWCTTCYTNEITVLFTDDIQEAFQEKGVELFIADFTSYDETIAQWIQKYNRVGVPVYVFYLPDEDEPIILPEIITKRMVFNVLDRLEDVE